MAVPSGVDPYEVLGVTSGAPQADVTAAYRRLAKRWHPDRAPSAEAADRMALINASYDHLRDEAERASSGDGPGPASRTGGPAGAPSWPRRSSGDAPADPFAERRPAGPAAPGADAGARSGSGAPGPWSAGRSRSGAAGEPLGPDADPGAPWVPGFDGRLHAHGGVPSPSEDDPGPRDGLAPAVRRALGLELRTALEPGETVGIVVPVTTWASPQTTLVVTDRRILYLLDDAPVHRVRVLPLVDVTDVRVRPSRPWRAGAQVVCTDRRGRRTTFGDVPPETAAAVMRRVLAGAERARA